MALPEPKPGLVIRYDYLWSREVAAGIDQGKDRPACLVAASDSTAKPRFVVILPITHSAPPGAEAPIFLDPAALPAPGFSFWRPAPSGDTAGIEIPPRVRQALGLDDEPCWVIVSEHNIDEWPNSGLRSLPGRPGVFGYGFVPPRLFAQIKEKFLELAEKSRTAGVRR